MALLCPFSSLDFVCIHLQVVQGCLINNMTQNHPGAAYYSIISSDGKVRKQCSLCWAKEGNRQNCRWVLAILHHQSSKCCLRLFEMITEGRVTQPRASYCQNSETGLSILV